MFYSANKFPRVLVVTTARTTRGGIASVVRAMEQDELWKKFSCRWIETQIDRNMLLKLVYLLRSYLQFVYFLPFYDLVHFHTVPGNSTLIHLPLLQWARLFGKKTIVHLHIGDQFRAYADNKPFRALLNRADLLLAISEMAKELLVSTYKMKVPVEVLYNACPEVKHMNLNLSKKFNVSDKYLSTEEKLSDQHSSPEEKLSDQHSSPKEKLSNQHSCPEVKLSNQHFSPEEKLSDQHSTPEVKLSDQNSSKGFEKILLVAGIIDRNKAYDVILKAFAQVAGNFPDWKLVFAGSGEVEEAQRIAGEFGISHQVSFPGWVSGELKAELFGGSSVYCLASYKEGFPVAVLEAWAWQLPVICTPAGGLADVVVDGENALVVEPGNSTQLAAAMSKLMADPAMRQRIAQRSHQLVNDRFAAPRIYRQLEEIYVNLKN